jgi:hypothetical protein
MFFLFQSNYYYCFQFRSHQQLEPLVKKPKPLIFSQPFVEDYRIQQPTSTTQSMQPTYWGNKIGGGNDIDPELPCPQNPYAQKKITNT